MSIYYIITPVYTVRLFVLRQLSSYIGCLQYSLGSVPLQNQRPVDGIRNPDKLQEDEKGCPHVLLGGCSVRVCVRAAMQMARAVCLEGTGTTALSLPVLRGMDGVSW